MSHLFGGVDHRIVHVDVNDLRAVGDLSAGYGKRFVIAAFLYKSEEFS